MTKMKKRLLFLALSLIIALSAFSCKRGGSGSETGTQIVETESTRIRDNGSDKNPPKVSEGGIPEGRVIINAERKAKYYCPDVFHATAVPCRINIETGEKQYACPVEGCDHFGQGCYYYNRWIKYLYDTGNFLIIRTLEYTGFPESVIAYEWDTGTVYNIWTFSGNGSDPVGELVPGIIDGEIMSYKKYSSTNYTYTNLYGINLYTGEVASKQRCEKLLDILFCDGGFVYALGWDGPYYYRTPESDPEPFVYPDGCSGFEVRKPGVLYRTDAPAAIYDIASKKTVKPDRKLDITSPVRSGDFFYYQSRGGIQTGKKSDGTEVKYVRYDNDIYRQGLDGKAEKFSIPTEYHFIVYAASGDWVIGRLMYRLSDGVYTPFEELGYDHIRINLTTGKAQLLNLYVEHDYCLD